MPFAKYSVDPERIEAMRAAFHRVCDVLQLDCGTEDRMTEPIVMKIVELAKTGELDPERLCIDTLAEVEPPPGRVGAEDYSPAPLTEPDVRASHPALWIGLSEWQQQLP